MVVLTSHSVMAFFPVKGSVDSMAMITCDHNNGNMGLCSSCAEDVRKSEESRAKYQTKRDELEKAFRIAEKYGCSEAAAQLWRVMHGSSG